MQFRLLPEEYATLESALQKWGSHDGHRAAMEECAETITAISHFQRGREGIDKVIAEAGDAFVNLALVIHSENDGEYRTDAMERLETAISVSFGKLAAKIEMDDKNYKEGRE